ncbi:MAG: M36 family metallopeptidase, partial [Candidatus Brocadiales bacterium]|nr:M36 family metallopeptidase [Candidatus Bathyanammoxibius sp.]
LNYPYLNYPNSLVKVEATVHYGTNWNGASSSYPKTLRFGDGDGISRNDYAKEDVVIFHEYQHLVTEYTTYDGLDGGHEEDAMDEAFSDYFGCSFAGTSKVGEYVKVASGSIRNLDNSYTVSDWVAAGYPEYSSYHQGSQVFSGAQWDLRQEFGQSIADILSFEGLNNLQQTSPDFSDGREAIIAADNANYGGSHVCTIKSIFANRGIGSPPSIPLAPTGLVLGNEGEYDEAPWLYWNSSAGATSYKVYRRFDGGSWVYVATTSYLGYTDYGATVNYDSDYWLEYYVTAVNCSGESGPSNIVGDWGYLEKRAIPDEGINLPVAYSLKPNYPNPFNPVTAIRYDLPEASRVSLVIYDIAGREVRRWNLQEQAGYRHVMWDARDQSGRMVPTGIYIYRLAATSTESDKRFTANRKMLLMK